MTLVRTRCKKEIIQVILYAAGSRSVELFSGKCCGFEKLRCVQVEAMLFFPLPYLSLCLYKHLNSDQECVFEVNPPDPLQMPHLTDWSNIAQTGFLPVETKKDVLRGSTQIIWDRYPVCLAWYVCLLLSCHLNPC